MNDYVECRVHVERESATTLGLYIDRVRRDDHGQYSCESDIDGQLTTRHYRLTVYGQPQPIHAVYFTV